jgi:hypothetical protein
VKRTLLKNSNPDLPDLQFIVSRTRKGVTELINTETGELQFVAESPTLETFDHHLSSVPWSESIPFASRPKNFVEELQAKRIELLKQNVKTRRKLHKGPKEPGEKRARKPRASKTSALTLALQAEIKSQLQALDPEVKAKLEKFLYRK